MYVNKHSFSLCDEKHSEHKTGLAKQKDQIIRKLYPSPLDCLIFLLGATRFRHNPFKRCSNAALSALRQKVSKI